MLEDLLDGTVDAGVHESQARRQLHFLVAISQATEQDLVRHAAARFVGGYKGKTRESRPPLEHIPGTGIIAPIVNQGEIQRQFTQAVPGATRHGTGEAHDGDADIFAVGIHEFA